MFYKKSFMKNLLLLVFILAFFGCEQRPKQIVYNPKATVYVTPAGDKIIFLEDYYRAYLKAIKANYKNRNSIYEERVQDSIFKSYFSKSEYAELVKSQLSSPIKDTTGLGNHIALIDSNRKKIEGLITSALAESNKYLKNDSLTIYIIPSDSDMGRIMQGMKGISGLTAGSKQIILTLDLTINTWEEHLPYAVAHEFNHTYWTKMNFKTAQWTLLNYLVLEGRADSYAHLIYPNVKCPWTSILSAKVEADLWNRIKSQLQNTNTSYRYSVMFGAQSRSPYPLWGGYTLGYHIVQSALKNHPELTPAEWINLSPEKILEMSDYK
jgi:uncharacterized protein YjaZ